MKKRLNVIYSRYLSLRKEVDDLSEKLIKQHSKHMHCKAGCDLCCMDYSIFPVEFYFILNQLKQNKFRPKIKVNHHKEDCTFLINHRCNIYNERPVICRTHGLPLLYMNDKGEWELSACELNFNEFDMEEFNSENTYPQDIFNSKLFMLNKEFVKESCEINNNEIDLVPLKNIIDYL
jgi:Fe-S-cluster containining protein